MKTKLKIQKLIYFFRNLFCFHRYSYQEYEHEIKSNKKSVTRTVESICSNCRKDLLKKHLVIKESLDLRMLEFIIECLGVISGLIYLSDNNVLLLMGFISTVIFTLAIKRSYSIQSSLFWLTYGICLLVWTYFFPPPYWMMIIIIFIQGLKCVLTLFTICVEKLLKDLDL